MPPLLYFICFLVAICATTLGALTGIGGGVIIKPILDLTGRFDASSASMLSSITVLSMAAVSVTQHIRKKTKIDFLTAIPLALGATVGGQLGGKGIKRLVAATGSNTQVTAAQNIILILLMTGVIFYMKNKERIGSLSLKGWLPAGFSGLFLGTTSAFLGIGGGPINVALILFLFSYSAKEAAVCSIITILFAQSAKVFPAVAAGEMVHYQLSALPLMICGGIAGGFIGTAFHKKISEKQVETLFRYAQIFVVVLCAVNIIRSV